MAPAEEAELESTEDARATPDPDALDDARAGAHALDEYEPSHGRGGAAAPRARPALQPASLPPRSDRAPQRLDSTAAAVGLEGDCDASAVSGSGDSRVPPPPPPPTRL